MTKQAMKLPLDINTVKGFLDPAEGRALFDAARSVAELGPVLEVGSYCGKSSVYLGAACKATGNTLFAVDHHRGSEEHQLGEEYHDADLYDASTKLMDSLPAFRATLREAQLEDCVVPIVAASSVAARHWQTPLGMVFIDGGHSFEAAMNDLHAWSPQLVANGLLAIHDIFENPEAGGQAPYEVLKLARASGLFEDYDRVQTLALLIRKP